MTRTLAYTMAAATVLAAFGCGDGSLPTSPSAAPVAETGGGTPAAPQGVPPATTARYRVTFEATWSRTSHPVDFPSSAHFSALVGGTHNGAVVFWREGRPASDGIKDMAERGRTSPLDREVEAAIAAGTAGQVVLGGMVGISPGSATAEFGVTPAFPLITLVSMVAPSPDWFVGVSGLSLADAGQWVSERTVDLVPWDAGTDSGVTFTSGDVVTSPPVPVFRIVTSPLAPSGQVAPVGRFVFRRTE